MVEAKAEGPKAWVAAVLVGVPAAAADLAAGKTGTAGPAVATAGGAMSAGPGEYVVASSEGSAGVERSCLVFSGQCWGCAVCAAWSPRC